jgi:hypothetical protein
MKYLCEMIIDAPIDKVTNLFADHNHYQAWQPGLIKVEPIKGAKQAYRLVFSLGNQEMVMKETVEDNALPKTYTLIYQVPGVWNRCVNQFVQTKDQTLWTMETEFQFDKDNHLPQDQFESKTLRGMQLFKNFVESFKSS